MKWGPILAREAVLFGFDVACIVNAIAWCAMAGHDERWRKGSTTMTLACDRCGQVRNTIPRR